MNFLNIHIIQTLPFSNLNRDDSGSPKSVSYGGTQRARLSSQAIKRAARVDFEAASTADMTVRSKYVAKKLHPLIKEMSLSIGLKLSDSDITALEAAANKAVKKLISAEKKGEESGDRTDTLVWLAESETQALAAKILEAHLAKAEDAPEELAWVQSATSSLTIAGFGRMFANAPELQTEAAVQLAHAFTTHQAVTEIDYFTAVDDLRAEYEGDSGAGHLDLAEFTSGVFYRYLNIDRSQLAENWVDLHEEDAQERLSAWVNCLLLSMPAGKQNSTAAKTLPSAILIQESTQPVSYASAFEHAVSDGGEGFTQSSVEALLAYKDKAQEVAGDLFGKSLLLSLDPSVDGDYTLAELLGFTAGWLAE